jgi:DNA-binding transcriptional LysR family regulator
MIANCLARGSNVPTVFDNMVLGLTVSHLRQPPLSQPAVSRALQRLRETFHDDLLIRTGSGYEPTPKGERLLQELSTTLPRLDRLLSGDEFDPNAEETTFRVAMTDHASHVLGPIFCQRVLPKAS